MKITPVSIVIPYKKQDSKLLLWFQVRKSDFLSGALEFPGGKVDIGETPLQAIQRETFEEVGVRLELADFDLFQQISHQYKDRHIMLNVYIYEDKTGLFPSGKHWTSVSEQWLLNNKDKIPSANFSIIKDILNYFC